LAALLALPVSYSAHAESAADCEQAGHSAEQRYVLPSGLLLAVGQVESGRWDPRLGRIVSWPWTVDNNGHGQLLNTKPEAVAAVRALQMNGERNIDVGCFQISLMYHPNAFTSLDQAFDPQVNADYAARLLVTLHAQLGDWQQAVAAYHSATPDLGLPYRQRVLAAWAVAPAFVAESGPQIAAFGIRIWTPVSAGAAPTSIEIQTQPSRSLPRVVTPAR
jgi:hypothetical protein